MGKSVFYTAVGAIIAGAMSLSTMGAAQAVDVQSERAEISKLSVISSGTLDEDSIEELFTKYITLDEKNTLHVNKDLIERSQYSEHLAELQSFAELLNKINVETSDKTSRDGWSFAKCVIADAVGVNMVARLTNGLYMAIRAAKWPLAAKTILQIGASAGLNLGWKANVVGLAIALGKSAFYCRGEW